jgi:hypothetical protein
MLVDHRRTAVRHGTMAWRMTATPQMAVNHLGIVTWRMMATPQVAVNHPGTMILRMMANLQVTVNHQSAITRAASRRYRRV